MASVTAAIEVIHEGRMQASRTRSTPVTGADDRSDSAEWSIRVAVVWRKRGIEHGISIKIYASAGAVPLEIGSPVPPMKGSL